MDDLVRSADGTPIAYTRAGDGPPVVLVGGSLDDGAENAPLAAALARSCTVVNYARRGRGVSGDAAAYAVERELEDLGALIAVCGGAAALYGVSTGGALALRAARAGIGVTRVGSTRCRSGPGRSGTRSGRRTSRRCASCSPPGVTGTRSSCSCGSPARTTPGSRARAPRRCGRRSRRWRRRSATTRRSSATAARPRGSRR